MVTGEVIRNITGPAVVISFAIAALASVLAGCFYIKFAFSIIERDLNRFRPVEWVR